MDGIFFLLLAFLTIITSIKLSEYGDTLGKQTKIGSAFIGGILIASITSLPELVTSFSAIFLNNPSLSFGDIVGSNMFNIFVLAVYNIYFFRKKIFKNISKRYILECFVLIIDYILIYLSIKNILVKYTTFILIFTYIIYMISVIFIKSDDEDEKDYKYDKYVAIKFIFTAFIMVFLSVMLTYQADVISHLYPKFSSSSIGAILLGVTTSLPEVVTTFSLLKLNNYNMAISNMLGSNIFNFFVLSIADIILKYRSIYSNADSHSIEYVYGGLFITFLFLLTLLNKKSKSIYYFVISLIMIMIYFVVWYLQFI